MDERIRLLTIAYMVMFLTLLLLCLYRVLDIGKMEKDVKAQYVKILSNYSCVPKGIQDTLYKDRSCIQHGYWYPVCPNETDYLKLYGG